VVQNKNQPHAFKPLLALLEPARFFHGNAGNFSEEICHTSYERRQLSGF
jgi:hypothetical protein